MFVADTYSSLAGDARSVFAVLFFAFDLIKQFLLGIFVAVNNESAQITVILVIFILETVLLVVLRPFKVCVGVYARGGGVPSVKKMVWCVWWCKDVGVGSMIF